MPQPTTWKDYEKALRQVGDRAAARLGNTRTVALQSYVHPSVFARWRDALGPRPVRKADDGEDAWWAAPDPDDEELETTSQFVIDGLGLDPLEL
jgi:DNA topoisomerase IB